MRGSVALTPGKVPVEVTEESSNECHEGMPMVVGGHLGEFVESDVGRGNSEHVRALERPSYSALRYHGEYASVHEQRDVAVQTRLATGTSGGARIEVRSW